MATVGVFVDIARQYYGVSLLDKNARINYERYLSKAVGDGELHRAYAYGVQMNDEAATFITALRNLNYEPKYRKAKIIKTADGTEKSSIRHTIWNVGIAMDVVRNIRHVDTVILGSNDPELVPLVEWIREQGVKVIVFSFAIPKELRLSADKCIEIHDDLLDIKTPRAEDN
jgi:uncharacterized LabA/DUF88 family protein